MGESRGLSSLSVIGRVRLRGLEGYLGSPYETAAAGHPLPIAPPPSSEAGHSTPRAAQVEHGVSHLVRVRVRGRVMGLGLVLLGWG